MFNRKQKSAKSIANARLEEIKKEVPAKQEVVTPGEWAQIRLTNMVNAMRDELGHLENDETKAADTLAKIQERKAEVESVIATLTPTQDGLKQYAPKLIAKPSVENVRKITDQTKEAAE